MGDSATLSAVILCFELGATTTQFTIFAAGAGPVGDARTVVALIVTRLVDGPVPPRPPPKVDLSYLAGEWTAYFDYQPNVLYPERILYNNGMLVLYAARQPNNANDYVTSTATLDASGALVAPGFGIRGIISPDRNRITFDNRSIWVRGAVGPPQPPPPQPPPQQQTWFAGEWTVACCGDQYPGGRMSIKPTGNGAYTGTMILPAGYSPGELTNIIVNGTSVEFERRTDEGPQRWVGQVTNVQGQLRLIGTWTGAYSSRFPNRLNWHAEKLSDSPPPPPQQQTWFAGEWTVACCSDQYPGGRMSIKPVGNGAYTGTMILPAGYSPGELTNIIVNGASVEFDRRTDEGPQRWIGQVTNAQGQLRLTGTWTGAYSSRFPGRLNWHAEKLP